jgi:hypothetical protein
MASFGGHSGLAQAVFVARHVIKLHFTSAICELEIFIEADGNVHPLCVYVSYASSVVLE